MRWSIGKISNVSAIHYDGLVLSLLGLNDGKIILKKVTFSPVYMLTCWLSSEDQGKKRLEVYYKARLDL